ncbi:MAG: class I SAM-dependent methyltransferase [Ignavibacteriaceae bacterium]|nr:class I SAM-dependent methyltransferase [Ignavibacteriaceae bacterium]
MIKAKPYQVLPLIYSHLMKRIKYDKWAEYLFTIVRKDCSNKSKVLELAAGDCSFAKYFNKYYPSITVTDLSRWMLKQNNYIKNKVCCDMLSLPFKSKYDLIYSNFDSINYILSGKSILAMFNEVSRLLNDNGTFIFDVSLEKNSYVHVKKNNRVGKYKGLTYKQTSTFNPATGMHINKFYIKLANGDEYSEIHKEKIYSFNTYFKLIDKTSLYVSDCYEAFSFKPGNQNSNRVLFVIKKNIHAEI